MFNTGKKILKNMYRSTNPIYYWQLLAANSNNVLHSALQFSACSWAVFSKADKLLSISLCGKIH